MLPDPLSSQSGSVPRCLASIDCVAGLGLASGRLPERGHSAFSPSTPQPCLRAHSLTMMALFLSLQLLQTQLPWVLGKIAPTLQHLWLWGFRDWLQLLGPGTLSRLDSSDTAHASRGHSHPLQPFDWAVFLLGRKTS